MAMAHAGYTGTSAHGVRLGNRTQDVTTFYGQPSRRLATTHGHNWSYDARGIAFQLQKGQVVSWLLYPRAIGR